MAENENPADSNLPSEISHEPYMGAERDTLPTPGSWWALAGDFPGKMPSLSPAALPPEDPLTLLVQDVRIHDGEIHSIHLARHPAWGSGTIRIMADEFLANFVPVEMPVAESRRAREIDALMGRSQEIAALMARGPDESELLRITDDLGEKAREEEEKAEARRLKEEAVRQAEIEGRKQKLSYHENQALRQKAWQSIPDRVAPKAPASTGLVPAALLPSGDVIAAQERIKGEITRMQAMQSWISNRAAEMTLVMGVVSTYQTEKVSAMTASISTRTKQATDMLAKVQTMKLFLGDDVESWAVSKGESAPADEPLHLMQSMLYLDEEILVEGFFGEGFRHHDLGDLPKLLEDNPALIERMMPHERCVAIARVRRHDVPVDIPEGVPFYKAFGAMLQQMAEQQADKRIFVLIRDGENVRVIIADEQTSRAERLFPSRAEIDAIYKVRAGRGESREISPQEIEYSDLRNEHDYRALFYKRFLIMLWGLHEREDAFGPFMPKGMNWLEQSVLSDRFVFVHDEENVLGDGKERVMSWLDRGHADIRPGSEVLIDTKLAFTVNSAPSAFKEDRNYRFWATRRPKDDYLRAVLSRSGENLIVQVPTLTDGYPARSVNTPMIVRNEAGETPDGVLNLGVATPDALLGYMNSRVSRRNYLNWFGLFNAALPIIRERHEEEKDVRREVMKDGVSEESATRAIALYRESVRGGNLPEDDAGTARIALLARALDNPADYDGDGVLGARLHASGRVTRLMAAEPRAGGIMLDEIVAAQGASRQTISSTMINPRSEALLFGEDRLRDHRKQIDKYALFGLRKPEDWAAMEALDREDYVRPDASAMSRSEAQEIADEFVRFNHYVNKGGQISYRKIIKPVGAIAVPVPQATHEGRRFYREDTRALIYGLQISPLTLAVRSGHTNIIEDAIRKVAKHPTSAMARVSDADAIRTVMARGSKHSSVSEILTALEKGDRYHFLGAGSIDETIAVSDPILSLALHAIPKGEFRDYVAERGRDALVIFGADALQDIGQDFARTGPQDQDPAP